VKITDIRFEQLEGVLESDIDLFRERLIRPIDIYPEHRAEGAKEMSAGRFQELGDGKWRVWNVVLSIDTDEGITGISGPMSVNEAFFVNSQLKSFLIGQDALATELIWDKMYRLLIHGRKGEAMFAVSAVDNALWDIRGKAANLPLYRLLGGPTRKTFPAYASALGFAINLEDAAATARGFADEGYTATKWFVRNGPMDGEPGARKNVELVRTLREAVGPDVDIMIDAWNSWDMRYALDMANRMAEFRPRWLEEVVKPDDIQGQARVNALSPVPISGGEHEYTRWGAREYFEAGAVDVYQADTVWAGGVSEMLKIFAMGSAFGVEVIPHGGAVPINAHLTAAQSPALTPLIEYLVHWNEFIQFFWKDPVKPVNGYITVSDLPGLGLEVDEAKVESRQTLDWS
jgi:L-alanine-DL-glutamate epimerase-like enolase superfamily enzyme